ncbi:MAG: hypothetical protein M3384_17680, partial [Acidobacteriota bacterium]|nr:hypothetical protein [Acidobacteriota bacterium]
ASLILQQVVCLVYGGVVIFMMSLLSVLLGVAAGVIMYYRFQRRVSCVVPEIKPDNDAGDIWREIYGRKIWKNALNDAQAN